MNVAVIRLGVIITKSNPFESPKTIEYQTGSTKAVAAATRWSWLNPVLAIAVFMLALPPIPLVLWAAGDEPFYGELTPQQLVFVRIAIWDLIGWIIVALTVVVATLTRRISVFWLLSLFLALFFGGLSFLTIEWVGSEQGWF